MHTLKIIKNNRKLIFGLTSEDRVKIKEALTFNNPAYENAKRYSKSKYISIPPYLTYYNESSINGEKVLSVPIGVNVCEILKVPFIPCTDKRVKHFVEYPKFQLDLREDQKTAESEYLDDVQYSTNPKCIIQLPTGKGKSILALHLAYKLKQKTLILVHKEDLVTGWKKDISLCFGYDFEVGLIKGSSRKVGKQITIATVQTLNLMSEEELSQYTRQFGLIVQDECHHLGLNIFNIIDKFSSYYKLGLSATPKRNDGIDFVFDLFFGGICYKHILTEDDKDICGVQVRVLDSPFIYQPFVEKGMVYNYYDFKPNELPKEIHFLEDIDYKKRPKVSFSNIDDVAVKSSKTKIMVCKKILEHYRQGHSIIALFSQKEHINLYYRHLCRYIPKDQIILYYGDNKEKSDKLMEKAENREVLVTLATYSKAKEGTNVKAWEVEFLVSSMNNAINVEQATGRVRRTKDGKLNPVIVYDIRYSNCYSLRSHYKTRYNTYKRLGYDIKDPKEKERRKGRKMFTRGYN